MKHLENFTAISGELKRHYRIKLNYPDRKLFSSPRRVTKWPIYTSKIKYILFTRVYTYHIFRGGHSRPLHFISHLSISCKQCSLCQCIYSLLADSLMVAFTWWINTILCCLPILLVNTIKGPAFSHCFRFSFSSWNISRVFLIYHRYIARQTCINPEVPPQPINTSTCLITCSAISRLPRN